VRLCIGYWLCLFGVNDGDPGLEADPLGDTRMQCGRGEHRVAGVGGWSVEDWDHGDEVVHRDNFGEEVGYVVVAWLPSGLELALSDAVAKPMELHGDDFGVLLFGHVVVGQFACYFVVEDDLCRTLWVAKVLGCFA